MELNITEFYNNTHHMSTYSSSIAESGEHAAAYTWNKAKKCEYLILDNNDKLAAFRSFVSESGGWDSKEIAAFTNNELNALCIQWIAGDIREAGFDNDNSSNAWILYEELSMQGTVSGRLFKDNDIIYFDIN